MQRHHWQLLRAKGRNAIKKWLQRYYYSLRLSIWCVDVVTKNSRPFPLSIKKKKILTRLRVTRESPLYVTRLNYSMLATQEISYKPILDHSVNKTWQLNQNLIYYKTTTTTTKIPCFFRFKMTVSVYWTEEESKLCSELFVLHFWTKYELLRWQQLQFQVHFQYLFSSFY